MTTSIGRGFLAVNKIEQAYALKEQDVVLKTDFISSLGQGVGGVQGSQRMPDHENYNHQIKPGSAGNVLRELIGGAIIEATADSAKLAPQDDQIGGEESKLAPENRLVFDANTGKVLLDSRYLDNVVGDLNAFAKKKGITITGKHVNISFEAQPENPLPGYLYVGGAEYAALRDDLAHAFAEAALAGNHDLNPGNMVVVTRAVVDGEGTMQYDEKTGEPKTELRLALIDPGHALNNRLKYAKLFGGKIRNPDNEIMDFFNRETLSHFKPSHQTPQLWRTYHGVVPSSELSAALRDISTRTSAALGGVDKVKKQVETLLNALGKDPENSARDQKTIEEIKQALVDIGKRVGVTKEGHDGRGVTLSKNTDTKTLLAAVFDNGLTRFVGERLFKMGEIADLMELQNEINMQLNAPPSKDWETNFKALETRYEKLVSDSTAPPATDLAPRKYQGIVRSGQGIEWIKEGKNSKSFVGNFEAYVKSKNPNIEKQGKKWINKLPENSDVKNSRGGINKPQFEIKSPLASVVPA